MWLQEFGIDHEPSGGNPPRFADLEHLRSFAAICAMYSDQAVMAAEEGPVRLHVLHTSGDPYQAMKPSLIAGRPFTAAEDRGEGSAVALLKAKAWRRYFAADPKVLNRALRLGSTDYQVVGIIDSDSRHIEFPEEVDVWTPINGDVARSDRRSGFLSEVARLAPGVSLQHAQAEVNAVAAQLARSYPATDKGRSIRLSPLRDYLSQEARRPLLTLFAASAAVLLVACVNISGLLLARGLSRSREAAIRIALGAGVSRVARLFFAESLWLAFTGCCLGLLAASLGIDALRVLLPANIPYLAAARLNGTAVAYAITTACLAVVLFGVLPAWQFARGGQAAGMKRNGRGIAFGGSQLRSTLVVVEIALSLVLLVTASLLTDSFFRMKNQSAGFNTSSAYSFYVPFSWDSSPSLLNSFSEKALLRLLTSPGVIAAGTVDALPLHGGSQSRPLLIKGQELEGALAVKQFSWRTATSGYFEAAGISLKSGRIYRDWMGGKGERDVVISDQLAKSLFPRGDALEHYISSAPRDRTKSPDWFRIVGVVGSVRLRPSDATSEAEVYVPWGATYWPQMHFVVKSNRGLDEFSRLVRNHVQPLTDLGILEQVDSLDHLIADSEASDRVRTILISGFAAAALALSAIGLFGTLSQEVTRRRQDFGVRLALGAEPISIAWLAVRWALIVTAVGLMMGLGVCTWTAQLVRGLLFEIHPWDVGAYLTAICILLMTAVSAALIPAIRAARTDPMTALRDE